MLIFGNTLYPFCKRSFMSCTQLIACSVGIVFIILACSCTHYPQDVERALKLAGDNRTELEKVLEHYRQSSGNKLKYRAACFLIADMIHYRYNTGAVLDNYQNQLYPVIVKHHISAEKAMDTLKMQYGELIYATKKDLQTIPSDFLIKDIDLAFNTWMQAPWGRTITFDIFCREILPYKAGMGPAEEWREMYYNYFYPLVDTITDPVRACQVIYDEIKRETWYYAEGVELPDKGAVTLLYNRVGTCNDQCQLMLYAMRSVGIAGGIDFYLRCPNKAGNMHFWNYVRNAGGGICEYLYDSFGPALCMTDTTRKKGKVYRVSYQKPNPLIRKKDDHSIPKTLKSFFLEDVTEDYFPGYKADIVVDNAPDDLVYLCVFNGTAWSAVDWAEIKKGVATFQSVEPNVLFLPACFKENVFYPVAQPFIVNDDNKVHYFDPDYQQREDIKVTRKFTLSPVMMLIKTFAIGGKFQASNNPEFHDANTLHTIANAADMRYCEIGFEQPPCYRYYRYLSADSGFCCMAEMEFYDQKNNTVAGNIIGTAGTRWNDPNYTKYAVFDGDPLTYFISKEYRGSWVGMDFGEETCISKIRYLFRNDDNSIREGDSYELLYYNSDKEWGSLGKQTGNREQELVFKNVPHNALFLLKNHTRGKEERPFTYENSKQIFW